MSPAVRIFAGSLIGAFLALLIHPATKDFYVWVFRLPKVSVTDADPAMRAQLPPPTTNETAAIWAQVAAERLEAGEQLTPKERASLQMIFRDRAAADPLNAFWLQMSATISAAPESSRFWTRASSRTGWNDFQSSRAQVIRRSIRKQYGGDQAWIDALSYFRVSSNTARIVSRFARTRIAKSDFSSPSSVQLRYETILNGNLIRTGAKSFATGDQGVQLVDIAAYPRELVSGSRPKRLYLGRNLLANSVRAAGREEDADEMLTIFQNSDGWAALLERVNPRRNAENLATMALLVPLIPGSALFLTLIGAAIFLVGSGLVQIASQRRLPRWSIFGLSLGLAAWAWLSSSSIFAVLALVVCGAVSFAQPPSVRKREIESPKSLGPLFSVMVGILALLVCVSLGGTFGLMHGPAQELIAFSSIKQDPILSAEALGPWTFIFMGPLFLLSVLWSYAVRLPTELILATGIRILGIWVSAFALICAVVVGPIAVNVDQQLKQTWDKLNLNEPVYYLQQ